MLTPFRQLLKIHNNDPKKVIEQRNAELLIWSIRRENHHPKPLSVWMDKELREASAQPWVAVCSPIYRTDFHYMEYVH